MRFWRKLLLSSKTSHFLPSLLCISSISTGSWKHPTNNNQSAVQTKEFYRSIHGGERVKIQTPGKYESCSENKKRGNCSIYDICHCFVKAKATMTSFTHWRCGFFTTREHEFPFSFAFGVFFSILSRIVSPPGLFSNNAAPTMITFFPWQDMKK